VDTPVSAVPEFQATQDTADPGYPVTLGLVGHQVILVTVDSVVILDSAERVGIVVSVDLVVTPVIVD
jgi:energy-converting hydrogenase Eha subunit B